MKLRKANRLLRGGWVWLGVSGLAALAGVAAGCGSGFATCADTRSCAPKPGEDGGAGGEPTAPVDAGAGGMGTGGEPPTGCEAGEQSCAGECIDLTSNADHCGACDSPCEADAICQSGRCEECPNGQLRCDGSCVDPLTDVTFCGASGRCDSDERGVACGANDVCQAGVCVSDNASLKSLALAPASLAPEFDAETLSYEATFPFYTPHLALTAVPASDAASVSVGGVAVAEGISFTPTPEEELQSVRVDVRGESGTKRAYDVSLKRAPVSTTYVKAFNSRKGFRYGSSVAIDGETVVVGAPSEDGYATGVDGNESTSGSGAAGSGAAYVMFRGSNGKWARQAYLKADTLAPGARFGAAVAVAGDTIAVGAPGLTNASGDAAGGVYIFVREGNAWTQQALLKGRAESGWLGSAVALEGDRLVVSAPRSGFVTYEGGAIYSYTRTGTSWTADAKHPNPTSEQLDSYAWLGYRLGFSNDRVIASGEQMDTVLVLLRSGNAWSVEQPIALSGYALQMANVAIDGDTLAVSAPGAVHVFTRSGSTWAKQASLTSFNEYATEGFGASLALEGDLLVVGSGCATCRGAFSTFVRDGDTWKDGAYVPTEFIETGDAHGGAVAVSGTRIVVGGPGEDGNGKGFNQNGANNSFADAGAAYIYE